MGKRLLRIASSKLPAALHGLDQHEINAVLQDGNTYFGKLQSFNTEQLVLADTRQHLHKLAFKDLYELVLDTSQKLN